MQPQQQNPTLNYSALTMPVSAQKIISGSNGKYILIASGISLGLFVLGVTLTLTSNPAAIAAIVAGLTVGLIPAVLYYSAIHAIRMHQFASDNAMTYVENMPYDGRPGVIFREGHSRVLSDILTAQNRSFDEIANYRYSVGSGKNETTYYYGVITIRLPRKLPNIVLDSKKNNSIFGSNLPVGFSADQKLELEGDFNNYFTLYAPAQYKTDALYIFTPDVMQALVDAAQNYDCEIIDDTLHLYSHNALMFNQKTLEDILHISGLIKKEVVEQVDNYADARIGNRAANIVAPQGQRLKTKTPAWTIILGVAMFIYFLFIMLG
jgi:hypothetical protein